MRKLQTIMIATTLFIGAAIPAGAQQPPSPAPPPTTPYGPPIGLDAAKKAMAAAEAEAKNNNWPMAIVILDSTGHTVMMERLDNTQYGSIGVAEDKAHSALDYRRPSKVFEDLVAQGGMNLRVLRPPEADEESVSQGRYRSTRGWWLPPTERPQSAHSRH
jgi:glc operon protein GlcG